MRCSNPKCEKSITNNIYFRFAKKRSFKLCYDCAPCQARDGEDMIFDLLTIFNDFELEYEGDMSHDNYKYYIELMDALNTTYNQHKEEIDLLNAEADDPDYSDRLGRLIKKL